MIGIIDYGMGNLRSVEKALQHLGYSSRRVTAPAELAGSEALVLPGVGSFGQAVENLKTQKLFDALRKEARGGKPLLGLCLGLQLLFDGSEEFGSHEGLGLLSGWVRRLPDEVQVPHIGWNEVRQLWPDPLFEDIERKAYFYFLHSYVADPDDNSVVVAVADHGATFPAVVRKGSVVAAQFHPEKSQAVGLRFLQNFAGAVCATRS